MKRFVVLGFLLLGTAAQAQTVKPEALRKHLFTIAHDSMGGRDTGSRGNYLTAEYVAAEFKKAGLKPAGDNGTYFQVIPFNHIHPDATAQLRVDGRTFVTGNDVLPLGAPLAWNPASISAISAGVITDTSTWVSSDVATGKFLIFSLPSSSDPRTTGAFLRRAMNDARYANAAAFAIAMLDRFPLDIRAQRMQGAYTTNAVTPATRPIIYVSSAAAEAMIGKQVSGSVRIVSEPLKWQARNVVGMLPGSDAALKNTYVSLSAHNDHVGYAFAAADHDSVYAYNRVIRVLGADTPDRTPTTDEANRIAQLRDSLKRAHPLRRDSIFNGADDDGTGTVALIEVAKALSGGKRPARSVLFVSHAAEERGLLGSRWFAEHATVPRDSIIGEMDMDMVGRGNKTDIAEGGPGYLEVIGASRLSKEYGALLNTVNARQPLPFEFNLTYDQPGHPLQYYCRADHYSYARYGIPSFAVSRGEHADYHQITDEPQYIDYNVLSRVANLALDFVRTVANLDHRPVLDSPKQDPNAPCRQ